MKLVNNVCFQKNPGKFVYRRRPSGLNALGRQGQEMVNQVGKGGFEGLGGLRGGIRGAAEKFGGGNILKKLFGMMKNVGGGAESAQGGGEGGGSMPQGLEQLLSGIGGLKNLKGKLKGILGKIG